MMVWQMIFLFQGCILRFHVNLPGCTFFRFRDVGVLVGGTELTMRVSFGKLQDTKQNTQDSQSNSWWHFITIDRSLRALHIPLVSQTVWGTQFWYERCQVGSKVMSNLQMMNFPINDTTFQLNVQIYILDRSSLPKTHLRLSQPWLYWGESATRYTTTICGTGVF